HHPLSPNPDRDPDLIFSQPSAPGREILRGLVQDLFFISALKRFLQYFQSDRTTYSVSPWRQLPPAPLRASGPPVPAGGGDPARPAGPLRGDGGAARLRAPPHPAHHDALSR